MSVRTLRGSGSNYAKRPALATGANHVLRSGLCEPHVPRCPGVVVSEVALEVHRVICWSRRRPIASAFEEEYTSIFNSVRCEEDRPLPLRQGLGDNQKSESRRGPIKEGARANTSFLRFVGGLCGLLAVVHGSITWGAGQRLIGLVGIIGFHAYRKCSGRVSGSGSVWRSYPYPYYQTVGPNGTRSRSSHLMVVPAVLVPVAVPQASTAGTSVWPARFHVAEPIARPPIARSQSDARRIRPERPNS